MSDMAIIGVLATALGVLAYIYSELRKELQAFRWLKMYSDLEATCVRRYITCPAGPHYEEALEYIEAEVATLLSDILYSDFSVRLRNKVIRDINITFHAFTDTLRAKMD